MVEFSTVSQAAEVETSESVTSRTYRAATASSISLTRVAKYASQYEVAVSYTSVVFVRRPTSSVTESFVGAAVGFGDGTSEDGSREGVDEGPDETDNDGADDGSVREEEGGGDDDGSKVGLADDDDGESVDPTTTTDEGMKLNRVEVGDEEKHF